MSFMMSYFALWLLFVFLMLVAIGLLRETTDLRRSLVQAGFRRDAPLVIGSRAPTFSALDARSGKVRSDLFHGRASLLAFISPQCSICRCLVYDFHSLLQRTPFPLVAVCKGDEEECKPFVERVSSEIPLLLDPRAEISELYGVSSYPVVVAMDADRRVRGYGYPRDARDLEELVARALQELNIYADSSDYVTKWTQQQVRPSVHRNGVGWPVEVRNRSLGRLRSVGHALLLIALATGVIAIRFDARLAVVPVAVVFGWTQIGGLWGISLIGALTHLGKVPRHQRLWTQSIVAYTCAGLLSATSLGVALGASGRLLVGSLPVEVRFLIVTLLSAALLARELGWIAFR